MIFVVKLSQEYPAICMRQLQDIFAVTTHDSSYDVQSRLLATFASRKLPSDYLTIIARCLCNFIPNLHSGQAFTSNALQISYSIPETIASLNIDLQIFKSDIRTKVVQISYNIIALSQNIGY